MSTNVSIAAYDAMIDALLQFEKRSLDIQAYLQKSAEVAKAALDGDDASVALETKVTRICTKMDETLERARRMNSAMQQTRDALIRLRSSAGEEE